jgi:hypothetical protein
MKKLYRVVKDCDSGFECQVKVWWLPFWFQMIEPHFGSNTHSTMEEALLFIKNSRIAKLSLFNLDTQTREILWEGYKKREITLIQTNE